MGVRAFVMLALLASLAAPTSAARQGQHDGEMSLEGHVEFQDDGQSGAAGQGGSQMQNRSLTGGPTIKQVKMASRSANLVKGVFSNFALGGKITSFNGVAAIIVRKGVEIWAKQQHIKLLRAALCEEFLHTDFESEMTRVWDGVIVPALTDEAAGCNDCDAIEVEVCEKGSMKNDKCLMVEHIAEHWLLYMETFLAVLAYISAHPDMCMSHLTQIQSSWNDLADGVHLATSTFYWKYEFNWQDFKNHPRAGQRETSMDGMTKQLQLGTKFNPFRSASSLERIIAVAKHLGIYDAEGRITAPECLE